MSNEPQEVFVRLCVCNHVTFAEALRIARAHKCRNVADVMEHCELGSSCGLCIPYMQHALLTHDSNVPLLDDEQRRQMTLLSGTVTS